MKPEEKVIRAQTMLYGFGLFKKKNDPEKAEINRIRDQLKTLEDNENYSFFLSEDEIKDAQKNIRSGRIKPENAAQYKKLISLTRKYNAFQKQYPTRTRKERKTNEKERLKKELALKLQWAAESKAYWDAVEKTKNKKTETKPKKKTKRVKTKHPKKAAKKV